MKNKKMLVVDDEEIIRDALKKIFEKEGYTVVTAKNGEEAISNVQKEGFDVIFLDIKMPGVDGIEALETIRVIDDNPEVIIITGYGSLETAVRALELGAYDYVTKPLGKKEKIIGMVKDALEKRELEQRIAALVKEPNILLVDDKRGMAEALKDVIEDAGYKIEIATDGIEALSKLKQGLFNILITDLKMSAMDGMELISAARKITPETLPIIITGYPSMDTAVESIRKGVYEYLTKPVDPEAMIAAIKRGWNKQRIEIQTRYLIKGIQRVNRELREAREYADNTIKSLADSLIVVNPDATITRVNRATLDLLGYKEQELIGKPVAAIFAEEEEEEEEEGSIFEGTRLKKLIKEGILRDYDMKYRTKDGEVIPVSFSGAVMRDKDGNIVGIVSIARDMREIKRLMEKEKELAVAAATAETEKKRAAELEASYKELRETQAKLIQAGKMSALGTMGAGIAHQLNQPLAGIRGFTQTILMQIDKKNPFYEDLKKIEEQTGYMRDVILNISGFARQTEFRKQPIDINEPIEKSLQLLSEQLRLHGVKLIKELDTNLPKVNADVNQMQQVFINFITNSREALEDMPKEAKKEVSIISRCNDSGDSVEIIFSDTGPGISKEIKDRIFDPFFTTKGPKSTGLGLSLNFGMVQDHGGSIEVKSESGKGATFVVKLPVVT